MGGSSDDPAKRKPALICTDAGQDFYYASPMWSTFHMRSQAELGYEVGKLRHQTPEPGVAFTPSKNVHQLNLKDLEDL